MKKLLRTSITLAMLLLTMPALADITEFVAPEELEAGQKGYGLTIFKGTKPERFEVEFVSTAPHPFYPKEKAILIRLGKPLQNSNVIGGMSGSPIYFKHKGKWKLAGALAFGYRLSSGGETVVGVTPIHLMVNQQKVLGLKSLTESESSTAMPEKNSDKLKPGDAIALVLSDGDYSDYSFGTVTYVQGNQFWAFGHAASGNGKVAFPAYKAEMAVSLKSSEPSFKISKELKEPVGVIIYDNVFAVEGKIQEIPENLMLPIKLQLTDQKGARANFSFRVLKNKLYATGLIADGVTALLANLWSNGNFAGSTSTAIIEFEDRAPIFLNDSMILGETVFFGPFSFTKGPWSAADKPIAFVDELLNSNFNYKLSGVQIKINLQPVEKTFYLDQLQIVNSKGIVIESTRPGEEISVVLALKSRDSSKKFLTIIPLKIPEGLNFKNPDQEKILTIHVQSGNHFTEQDENKKIRHSPESAEEFLQMLILNEQPVQKIYLQAVLPPTQLSSTPITLPPLAQWQWHAVETLDFLKTMSGSEVKVLATDLMPPLADFILEIDREITLKLLPPKPKQPENKDQKIVKAKPKHKSLW